MQIVQVLCPYTLLTGLSLLSVRCHHHLPDEQGELGPGSEPFSDGEADKSPPTWMPSQYGSSIMSEL